MGACSRCTILTPTSPSFGRKTVSLQFPQVLTGTGAIVFAGSICARDLVFRLAPNLTPSTKGVGNSQTRAAGFELSAQAAINSPLMSVSKTGRSRSRPTSIAALTACS